MEFDSNGNITISLVEIIENMDAEARAGIVRQFAWEDILNEQLGDIFKNEYAAPRYNDDLFKSRIAALSSDEKNRMFRDVIGKLMRELKQEKQNRERWIRAFWRLWRQWPDGSPVYDVESFDIAETPSDSDIEQAIEYFSKTVVGGE